MATPLGVSMLRKKSDKIRDTIAAYEQLAKRLKAHGIDENAASIAKKISRGTFAATFFLACLVALEFDGIRIEDI